MSTWRGCPAAFAPGSGGGDLGEIDTMTLIVAPRDIIGMDYRVRNLD